MHPFSFSIPITSHSLLFFFFSLTTITTTAAPDSFVYGGCARIKYAPSSHYESNLDSLLTSLVNSAMYTPFNNFSFALSSPPNNNDDDDVLYGLYQCQGNLPQPQCLTCVQRALTRLGPLCAGSCGGVIQLEGCLVKYDNATFLGVEEKVVMVRKCGPGVGYNSEALTRRDEVMSFLQARGRDWFRVGEVGSVRGVAQCTGDLSAAQCQDCLAAAIGRLKNECATASWGDIFLAKCYVRYTTAGDHSSASNGTSEDDEIEKSLAILVGLIAAVALIIIFLAFLRKSCDGKDGK